MTGKIINLSALPDADRKLSPEGGGQTHMVSMQKIRFVDKARSDEEVVRVFDDPYPRLAVLETVETADLPTAGGDQSDAEGFLVVFLASGSATPYEWQKRAEEWIAEDPSASGQSLAELTVQNDRVWWRIGRAVVIGAQDRRREICAALTDFAFYEAELRKLEREVEQRIRAADEDVPLTHQVNRNDLQRWSHVNEQTETATRLRMRYVRLEPCLEKSPADLGGPARRMYSELILQTEISDRLGYLDDKLEVLEDLYELANDRLSEFSYFRREYRLEVGIVLILFVEVLVMLWEIYVVSD